MNRLQFIRNLLLAPFAAKVALAKPVTTAKADVVVAHPVTSLYGQLKSLFNYRDSVQPVKGTNETAVYERFDATSTFVTKAVLTRPPEAPLTNKVPNGTTTGRLSSSRENFANGPYRRVIEVAPPKLHGTVHDSHVFAINLIDRPYTYQQVRMADIVYYTDPATKAAYVIKNRWGRIGWMSRATLDAIIKYSA